MTEGERQRYTPKERLHYLAYGGLKHRSIEDCKAQEAGWWKAYRLHRVRGGEEPQGLRVKEGEGGGEASG